MSDNPRKLLDALRSKMYDLMRSCDHLKNEKSQLEGKLEKKRQIIAELQKELDEMNLKYQNLKMATGVALSEGDVKEARNRFNKLVREIEKCISLLNE